MRRLMICAMLFCAAACGGSTGRVQVFVEAEDTIPNGLVAGPGDEEIVDGWSVTYQKFLIGFGNFRARQSGDASLVLEEPKQLIIDMKALPQGGFVFADFKDVEATRWDRVGFSLVGGDRVGVVAADGTSDMDLALMKAGNYSVYFEAKLAKPGGQSCKPGAPLDCVPRSELTVKWGVPAGTTFDDCAPPQGQAGFAVPSGGTVQVKPTIHGDHWFFTNFTQGAEITQRRAQWMVDSDLDRNGETTIDELKAVKAADVFPSATYNLTGGIDPVNFAYDYLVVQARTLGDYQGEGECPTRSKL